MKTLNSKFLILNSQAASVFAAWWWGGDSHGEWTVDGGWHWIDVPSVWGSGACLWMPKFRGAPDVEHLGVDDFPATFTAVLADCCRTNGVTYQWTTPTDGIRIVSPNAQTTEVVVDSVPSWDYFSLTVEASLAGETLTSTLQTTYGTNSTPQVSFGLSLPEVMFANDDDDDGDGVADCLHVTPADNDIAMGALTFRSDIATNATLRIESISGFDAGFVEGVENFVFLDSDCTQPVREGFGVWYHENSDNRRIYQKSIAPIGFGTSRGFRMPQCQ